MFETLKELLAWIPPKHKEIISSGILPVGAKLVLAGEEESFKTMLSTYAGFCISMGLPLLGFKTTKMRVGMLQSELPKHMFRDRIAQLVKEHNHPLAAADIHFATALDIKLNKPAGFTQLAAAVKNLGLGLLILDPLYKVLSGDVSDWQEMVRLTDNLDYLCRQFNCGIWLVHHRRKFLLSSGGIMDLGGDELIGSSALKDWADTILRLDKLEGDERILRFSKARNAKDILHPMKIKFNRRDLSFNIVAPDITAKELK